MSIYGVIVVRILPHSDYTRREEILPISPYLVRMRENTDQNNSEYGHFLRSEVFTNRNILFCTFPHSLLLKLCT